MTRAYAIALAAGTQVLTLGIGPRRVRRLGARHRPGLGAGWVVNLAVAELLIRRWAVRPAAIAPVGAS